MSHKESKIIRQRVLIVTLFCSLSSHIPCTPPLLGVGVVSLRVRLLLWCSPDFNIKEKLCRLSPDREKTITQQSNWIKVLTLKDSQTIFWEPKKTTTKENLARLDLVERGWVCGQCLCHICMQTKNMMLQREREKTQRAGARIEDNRKDDERLYFLLLF